MKYKKMSSLSSVWILLLFFFTFDQAQASSNRDNLDDLSITADESGVTLTIDRGQGPILTGNLGISLPDFLKTPISCSQDGINLCWNWGSSANLRVVKSSDNACYEISWSTKGLSSSRDCFDIGTAKWFAGLEEHDQFFPLSINSPRKTIPVVPGDMLQDKEEYFGGVCEPWWINSNGIGIWVPEGVPLLYSWNEANSSQMCLEARYEFPYVYSDPDSLQLNYSICVQDNAKEVQIYGAKNLLGLPKGIPDERMISMPIWSTWAQYKTQINDSIILQFANDIRGYGFNDSQLEIDDDWETCYGEAEFDPEKFPDPAGTVSLLKSLGFRVTLWIHPFVNLNCPTWNEVALLPQGYFVKSTKNKSIVGHLPGLTFWWQGNLAGYVDFTNSRAVQWWTDRLEDLRTNFGIDSFKFDAGEANWLPASIYLSGGENPQMWPEIFTTRYVESVADAFGGQIEVRVGRRSQTQPIFVRMLDKDSVWGYGNGLKTMVTTLLQMGIAGYPFVLPDMIGGNGYLSDPSRELYIRWLQANVFMPSMQFSYVPWKYDQEVISHALNMTRLHLQYAPTIIQLAQEATTSGAPINRPIWWLDPTDQDALAVDSEFLLGNDILVAPVMEKGATTRDIYLPLGVWRDEADPAHPSFNGPMWLRDYNADLFTLPYFTRIATKATDEL